MSSGIDVQSRLEWSVGPLLFAYSFHFPRFNFPFLKRYFRYAISEPDTFPMKMVIIND